MRYPRDLPTYSITEGMTSNLVEISRAVTLIEAVPTRQRLLRLRKESNIRSVRSSLSIEGNSLDLAQVSAIVDGKKIAGPFDEVQEVENAYRAYASMDDLDPYSVDDFLRMADVMMFGLVPDEMAFRDHGVAVFKGDEPIHIAPGAEHVERMMREVFEWGRESDAHPLIKGSVIHYLIEYVHPFPDGNGRMGRLWHTVILGKWNPVFYTIPLETQVKARQEKYYDVLDRCGRSMDCTEFVEFFLGLISNAVEEAASFRGDGGIPRLLEAMDGGPLSAKEMMDILGLSHRTHFKRSYIDPAIESGLIEMTEPENPRSRRQKYRRTDRGI